MQPVAYPAEYLPETEKEPLTARTIRDTLYNVALSYVDQEADLEALLGESPLPSERGKRKRLKWDYTLAYRDLRWANAGLLGSQMSATTFAERVRNSIGVVLLDLQRGQPGLQWALACFQVEPKQMSRTREVPVAADHRIGPGTVPTPVGPREGVGLQQRQNPEVALVQAPDARWVLHMVFYDVSQGDLDDPNIRGGDGSTKNRPYEAYAESGFDIRAAPAGLRKNRRLAEQVVRNVLAFREAQPDEAPPEAGVLTLEQVQIAAELRRGGTSPHAIAKLLQVEVEDLNRALDRIEVRPPEAPSRTP